VIFVPGFLSNQARVLVLATMFFALSASAADLGQQVEPILRDNCYSCHGAKKQKGGLRLDSSEAIARGGKNGAAIVPGKAEDSPLYQRINLPDGDEDVMPAKGDRLSAEQIALIGAWINAMKPLAAQPAAGPKPVAKAGGDEAPRAELILPETDLDLAAKSMGPADGKILELLDQSGVWTRALTANGALVELDFSHATINEQSLQGLNSLGDHVAWLNFGNHAITDTHLALVGKLKNLRRLHLEHSAVTDAGMAALANASELEYLNLRETKVSDGGLLQLIALRKLRTLYLPKSAVQDTTLQALRSACPHLVINGGE
jgi:mono/diheme cytochrome c family protein